MSRRCCALPPASDQGIGRVTAAVLNGQLPELGRTSAKAIAALAGLASYYDDSGASHGKRSVRGGLIALAHGPLYACPELV